MSRARFPLIRLLFLFFSLTEQYKLHIIGESIQFKTSIFTQRQHKETLKPEQERSVSFLHELTQCYLNSCHRLGLISWALHDIGSDSNINTMFSHEGIRRWGKSMSKMDPWIVQAIFFFWQFFLGKQGDAWSIYLGSRGPDPNVNFLGNVLWFI